MKIQRDLALHLASTSDLKEAFNLILDTCIQIEGIDSGGVYLFDEITESLHLTTYKGLSQKFIDASSYYDAASSQVQFVKQGNPSYINFSEYPFDSQPAIFQEELHALAVIPVLKEDRVIAVLNLASHTNKELSPIARNRLETIAMQIGGVVARVKAETALRESEEIFRILAEKLQKANNELQEFAYVISHDLKEPLRGIKTISDWLISDYQEKLDEEGQEYLALLNRRVQRLNALIQGISEYKKIDTTKGDKILIDTNQLISEMLELLIIPANMKIEITKKLPTISGSKVRISQVFQNLLSNALKFNDKSNGLIQINYEDFNQFWKFHVTDNGQGIEERHFNRIFQLFQTLNPKDEVEGSGIGLAIVKKIIEAEGGKIWVESALGEGTTFIFTIPKNGIV